MTLSSVKQTQEIIMAQQKNTPIWNHVRAAFEDANIGIRRTGWGSNYNDPQGGTNGVIKRRLNMQSVVAESAGPAKVAAFKKALERRLQDWGNENGMLVELTQVSVSKDSTPMIWFETRAANPSVEVSPEFFDRFSRTTLAAMAADLDLPAYGTKAQLIERLKLAA